MAQLKYEKVVVVKRSTRLEELKVRFHSLIQIKFYLERLGVNYSELLQEDENYKSTLRIVKAAISEIDDLKLQVVDRSLLPNFVFGPKDLAVVVGQDGMVANVAKYARKVPIMGVNPDPDRIDGVLLKFRSEEFKDALNSVLAGSGEAKKVTLAEASTQDGQKLFAFNDFFVGAKTHTSARYEVRLVSKAEHQSSSGIIVSTDAGSTGWLSSVFNEVNAIKKSFKMKTYSKPKME